MQISNPRSKIKKPIERIIENLVYETPAPPRGIHQIEYNISNEKYILTQPHVNALPQVSLELEKIFSYFKIEQTLEIYTHILLEKKVIFFSNDKSILSTMIEGFLCLIYPFKYCHHNITVLPMNSLYVLENFSSYVIGINVSYSKTFFSDLNLEVLDSILIIDLEGKEILNYSSRNYNELSHILFLDDIVPAHTNGTTPLSHQNSINNQSNSKTAEESLNPFLLPSLQIPKYHKDRVKQKISNYIREIKLNTDKKEERDNFINVIRQIFYSLIVNLLLEYSNYVISSDEDFKNINGVINSNWPSGVNFNLKPKLTINHLFRTEEFLSYAIKNFDRPFYKKLLETKMFYNFIYKKLFPQTDDDKIQILHFDERIVEKNNKKIFSKTVFTPVINCKKFEISFTHTVGKVNTFTTDEINYFKEFNNAREALKNGQEIIWENDDEMYVVYHIFPKLVYDLKFLKEISDRTIKNQEINSYIHKDLKFPLYMFIEVNNVIGEILANPSSYMIYSNIGHKFSKEFYS